MPFDGIVTKSITFELKDLLTGARIEKIYQTERDEIIVLIRARNSSYRLLASANASFPRIHLTNAQNDNPLSPPMFCMLLRKHLSGSRISDVVFHDYERIITLAVESVDEIGDVEQKRLIIEVMGRYSNIMLIDSKGVILDAIKHVDEQMSSVREVLPGIPYVYPPVQDKKNADAIDIQEIFKNMHFYQHPDKSLERFILDSILGFSPLLCREVCFRSGLEPSIRIGSLNDEKVKDVSSVLKEIIQQIRTSTFKPCIVFDNKVPVDFHCLDIKSFNNRVYFETTNEAADEYYHIKADAYKLEQKKSALARTIVSDLERCRNKRSLQEEALRESADKDKFRLFGELLIAGSHSIAKNNSLVRLQNYYSSEGTFVEIPLDPELSALENAQAYFRKYRKAVNTYSSTEVQLADTIKEISYLETTLHLLESAASLPEVEEIREEIVSQDSLSIHKRIKQNKHGQQQRQLYQLKKSNRSKPGSPLPPHTYTSTDNYTILAGRNNTQNDKLTFKQASNNDIWMHTQKIPGSHVIIRIAGRTDIPDRVFEEAAMIAAWHSTAKNSSGVPVDYTQVRNIKKPPGSKPGYVIYDNYKTIFVTPTADKVASMKHDPVNHDIE